MKLFLTSLLAATISASNTFNYGLWDKLTKEHFSPNKLWHGVNKTVVDYCGFAADVRFGQVIDSIANADLSGPDITREEWLASHINIYNALVIATIVKHPYFESTGKCIGSITNITDNGVDAFSLKEFNVGGVMLSMDEVEFRVTSDIKSVWGFEPDCRVHATLVCGGISCPNLLPGAYYPNTIYDQLEERMKFWMTNGDIGARLGNLGGQPDLYYVTHIFYWYREQFAYCSGTNTATDFFIKFLQPDGVKYFQDATRQPIQLQYMPYDWNLNGPYNSCRQCSF